MQIIELQLTTDTGVRRGDTDGFLRASIVGHPVRRRATGESASAVSHTRIVAGDRLTRRVMANGGRCENRSRLKMCTPAAAVKGMIGKGVRSGPVPAAMRRYGCG